MEKIIRSVPRILAIDIGNTAITCGLFRKDRLVRRFCVPTRSADYFKALKKGIGKAAPEAAIVSSVVPKATTRIWMALRFLKATDIRILGKNCRVPIVNRYQHPKQVGQDRLVNAFAAVRLYGTPAIVIDFGTAISFDIVSGKGEYLGGMILPGLETSLLALNEKAALLPAISLGKPPGSLIGRTTRDNMLSGVIFGFSRLTDGLIKDLKAKLGPSCKTIGTGGTISFISPYCKNIKTIDPNLTLKGLQLIYAGLTR